MFVRYRAGASGERASLKWLLVFLRALHTIQGQYMRTTKMVIYFEMSNTVFTVEAGR